MSTCGPYPNREPPPVRIKYPDMPQRDTTGIGERVPRALIDADFTIAFSLVEMAASESRRHNEQLASELLQKAGRMLDDIRGRLLPLTASQKGEFEARCAELAKAIELARAPVPGESDGAPAKPHG
jgi:hypothetical protein